MKKLWSVLILFVLLSACSSVSHFDQHAYILTTSAKVDALNLMSMADEPFTEHKREVNEVLSDLDKLYEYERNRSNNAITLQLWDKIRDSSGHLFMGFIVRWKTDGRLKPAFIKNAQAQTALAFDIIAQLESKKIGPKQAQNIAL